MKLSLGSISLGGGNGVPSKIKSVLSSKSGFYISPQKTATVFSDAGETIASIDDAIAQINDLSINANNLSQSTESYRPVLKQDGNYKSLLFADYDRLYLTQPSMASGYALFAVVRLPTAVTAIPAAYGRVCSVESDDLALYFTKVDGTLKLKSVPIATRPFIMWDQYQRTDKYAVISAVATLAHQSLRLNGQEVSAESNVVAAFNCSGDFGIGTQSAAPYAFPGYVRQVVLIAGTVTDVERERIEKELCRINGIAYLPSAVTSMRAVAHRGYSAVAPENTLPAYTAAAAAGFRYCECDIDLTSDSEWILMHDATVDRTTDGTGNVVDFTLAQIKELDAGSWFGVEFAGTEVPTLMEFLQACQNLGLHPYIEIKTGSVSEANAQKIIDAIDATVGRSNATVISFNLPPLNTVRSLDTTALIELGYVAADFTSEKLDAVAALGNAFFDTEVSNLTGANMILADSKGVPVEFWTATTTAQKIRIANMGGRGVTSNEPL